MAKKKAFVLRISPEQISALETWAQDEFRSINGQIEFLLNDALKKAGRLKNINLPEAGAAEDKTE